MDIKELVVIGGGPGGYAAAFYAADKGLDVTLIEKEENPGGVCLYRGCIPSKALLHIAKLINEVKEAEHWGVKFSEPEIDLDKLREFKNSVVQKLTGGTGQLAKQRKITYIRGTASFVNSNTVIVKKHDGSTEEIQYKKAILATGSVPVKIPAFDISDKVMDSTGALELNDIPEKFLVVGGGYIGLELGSVYAAIGSKVTVVEMMDGLLPGADRDLVRVLERTLKPRFEEVLLSTKVVEMSEENGKIRVRFEGKKVKEPVQYFDRVLVSVGRKPVTTGFGIENTNIRVDDKGFVITDEKMQTDDPSIFAIGDLVGNPMLAHKASAEGKVAVEAVMGEKTAFEPNAIPAVVFTDPELAWAGITENEAKEQGLNVEIAKFPWGASGRATTIGRNDGLTKLIIEPETGRILGMGMVGVGAGDMIAEGALAVEMAALAKDVAMTIHPHPTLSETIMESAEAFYGHSTHVYKPKRK